jgi:hypothetical protein
VSLAARTGRLVTTDSLSSHRGACQRLAQAKIAMNTTIRAATTRTAM